MKKWLIGIICVLFILTINGKNVSANNEAFETVKNKVLMISSEDEIKEVKEGYLVVNTNFINYVYENNEVLKIEEEYFCHTIDQEYLYLISKNNNSFMLSKVNKKTKKRITSVIEIDNPTSMIISDNEILVVGSDDKDAVIFKYDMNLNYLFKYQYGGLGYESFNEVYDTGEDLLLIGIKDAHSLNSPFLNVGSTGEQKVFVVKISKQGIILDTCYFNHQAVVEELDETIFKFNSLMVKIKVDNQYYIYFIDENLDISNYQELEIKGQNQSIISNTNDLLIIQETNTLNLLKEDDIYDLEIPGILKKVEMIDNVLRIYYYQDYYLWEMAVYQYQIIKQEEIVINKLKAEFNEMMDMNTLEEIKVESFIHSLDLKLNKIDPFFSKQVHGTYSGFFEIIINKQKSYSLNIPIIVEEYVNVYDGYTYQTGYSLNFTGYALLDNKSIVSGYKVNEEGLHNLVITDNLGNKSKYTFRIVNDEYYQEVPDENYLKADYIVNKNQEVKIEIKTNELVEDIYVNGEKGTFEITEQGIDIKLTSFDKPGLYPITIDKIVYQDDIYELNKTYLIRVLKEAPIVNIKEEKSENLKISLDVKDEDKSLENLKFVVYDNEGISEVYYLDYNNINISLGNIQKDKEYKIKGFFIYDQGFGTLKEEEFFDSSFKINMDEYLIIAADVDKETSDITVEFFTNNPQLNIVKLKVGNTDLKEKYQIINNYTPLYISIGLSVLVGGMAVCYYFYHKRKMKR